MTTLILTGRSQTPRSVTDGAAQGIRNRCCFRVVSCVFLEMLLDLSRESTWKMVPIKRMEEFDPVFCQETFRFTQDEITEILSSMRDLDGNLLVDENDNPHMISHIVKTPREYM